MADDTTTDATNPYWDALQSDFGPNGTGGGGSGYVIIKVVG